MLTQAVQQTKELKVGIRFMRQAVEALSVGQRQRMAVAEAMAAALGVREGSRVLKIISRVRDKGLPVILINHNIPHVFKIADHIHIQRLGKRATVVNPKQISMSETVAVMTGTKRPEELPDWALA